MNLKQKYTVFFSENLKSYLSPEDITDIKNKIWFNLRNNRNSLRLTDIGLDYVKQADIRTYEIEFPKDLKLSAQVLIWLDRYLESPYHLSSKKIIVITEKSAIELHLFSGDLQKYGVTKTLNKRLSQNLHH